jgi:hypothetical protein
MTNQFLCSFLAIMLYSGANYHTPPVMAADRVCGKWELSEENLVIRVYREGGEFKAKIVCFDDHDDTKDMITTVKF